MAYELRHVRHGQVFSRPHDDHALDAVLQLPHVSGPVVGRQQFQGLRVDALDRFVLPLSEPADAVVDQQGEVFLPLTQRRKGKRHHAQPVIEVLPEPPALDLGFQVPVRRGDDPGVRLEPVAAAHPLELALLQDPQQFDLGGRRELAHFIEEERAAVGQFEPSPVGLDRVRERASFVAEQFAFDHPLREGVAEDGHEGLVPPGTAVVEGVGHQFLARAAFAEDQHRGLGVGDLEDLLADALHGRGPSHDVLESIPGVQLVLQRPVLPDDALPVQDLFDLRRELLLVHGFLEYVVRAFLHGGHGEVHGPGFRHQDDAHFRIPAEGDAHQPQSVYAGGAQFRDDDIRGFRGQDVERLVAVFHGDHTVSAPGQAVVFPVPVPGGSFDQQDDGFCRTVHGMRFGGQEKGRRGFRTGRGFRPVRGFVPGRRPVRGFVPGRFGALSKLRQRRVDVNR